MLFERRRYLVCIYLFAFFLGEVGIAGTPDQDPIVAELRRIVLSSTSAQITPDDISLGSTWYCNIYNAVRDRFDVAEKNRFNFERVEGQIFINSIGSEYLVFNEHGFVGRSREGSYYLGKIDDEDVLYGERSDSSSSTDATVSSVIFPGKRATHYYVCEIRDAD